MRLQEQMLALADEEDQYLFQHMEAGEHQESGLESYARFTAENDEANDKFVNIDEPNPILNEASLEKPEKQDEKKTSRGQCTGCIVQ